jgi:anti-anti-sigma regulatory factor
VSAVQEVTVVCPTDEVLNEDSLRPALRLGEESPAPTVYLDLGGVRLPTAEGLGLLVTLAAELRSLGGGLVLVNVPADTYEVLAVTHLVGVLDVRPAFPP